MRFWKDSDPEFIGAFSSVPADIRQRLVHVAGDEAPTSRGRGLFRCRACGAFFEYQRDYEFLLGGSEDEERWTRIDAAAAAERWRLP